MSTAYQQAQLNMGVFNAVPVSVGDLFMGALLPGLVLVLFYLAYLLYVGIRHPNRAPAFEDEHQPSGSALISSILPPLALIALVLGSIVSGAATPTEAAGIGALAALAMAAFKGKLGIDVLRDVGRSTTKVTAMVFAILLGASLFSLVFHGFGGETLIKNMFEALPGGKYGALIVVMLILFFLGFILDFIEITFVVVPLIAPALLQMGFDPIWLGIMIAVNLQTSFLTPPFGFALFYLRGVAPKSLQTTAIYRGTLPFIVIQLCLLVVLIVWPQLVTWLPNSLKL
jgi:tripartite ATP-independent transporter DctM subunit